MDINPEWLIQMIIGISNSLESIDESLKKLVAKAEADNPTREETSS